MARYELPLSSSEPLRVKEAIVLLRLLEQSYWSKGADFNYQPLNCGRSYRLVVVRKNNQHQKGNGALWTTLNTLLPH